MQRVHPFELQKSLTHFNILTLTNIYDDLEQGKLLFLISCRAFFQSV